MYHGSRDHEKGPTAQTGTPGKLPGRNPTSLGLNDVQKLARGQVQGSAPAESRAEQRDRACKGRRGREPGEVGSL